MIAHNAIIRTDYVLDLLCEKIGLRPIVLALVFPALSLLMVPWAMSTGVWDSVKYGLSQSYTTYIGDCILGVANYYIVVYYYKIPESFNKLYKRNTIYCSERCGSSVFERAYSFYSGRYRLYIYPACLAASILLHTTFLLDDFHGWTESVPGRWSLLGLYHMVFLSVQLGIIVNFAITVYMTAKFFWYIKESSNKKCLSYSFLTVCKERSGGLRPIGDLAVNVNTVFFVIGFYLSCIVFSILSFRSINPGNYEVWQLVELYIPIPFYFIFCPVVFFFQVWPGHMLMKERKEELVDVVINKNKESVCFTLEAVENIVRNKDGAKNIARVNEVCSTIMALPEWPFGNQALIRVAVAVVIPTGLMMAQHLSVVTQFLGHLSFP